MPRITPHLWFDGEAEEAARFYTSIFPNSRVHGSPARYDGPTSEVSGQPEGSVMVVEFALDGQPFVALNGGPHFAFNESISFIVECADQEEVDHYWEKLGEGGDPRAQQCGWLKDKFGVSWQVVPSELPELLGDPDPEAAERVSSAMLRMKKLDVRTLREARDGVVGKGVA